MVTAFSLHSSDCGRVLQSHCVEMETKEIKSPQLVTREAGIQIHVKHNSLVMLSQKEHRALGHWVTSQRKHLLCCFSTLLVFNRPVIIHACYNVQGTGWLQNPRTYCLPLASARRASRTAGPISSPLYRTTQSLAGCTGQVGGLSAYGGRTAREPKAQSKQFV